MNIRILHLVEGAKAARGITVVIDVFRAMSVEACVMAAGARRIYPVGDIQIAYDYKAANPDAILIGERGGAIQPGFDFGNSPSQIEGADLRGKNVVHTTSAGTQGLANADQADEILTGSLLNASAIARYIRQKNPAEVSLVCMGLAAVAQTEEDNLCAAYIKSLLEDQPMDLTDGIENLKVTSGAKFFDPAKAEVFPEADFYACTQVDRFDFVLRLVKNPDGLDYIEKIDV